VANSSNDRPAINGREQLRFWAWRSRRTWSAEHEAQNHRHWTSGQNKWARSSIKNLRFQE